jgi:membrane protein involved in colicin uptake
MYALLALAALLGITAGVQTVRLSHEQAAHATTKAKNAEAWITQANLATKAEQAARRAEEANAAATLAAKDQLTEALTNGKARADSLTADLLSAKRQLRDFWTTPSPGSGGGAEDSATLASRQEAAQLRAQAIGAVLNIGAEADARETYLIQRYDSAVSTCNGVH